MVTKVVASGVPNKALKLRKIRRASSPRVVGRLEKGGISRAYSLHGTSYSPPQLSSNPLGRRHTTNSQMVAYKIFLRFKAIKKIRQGAIISARVHFF